MARWVLEKDPKRIPHPIDPKIYKQNIAEIAELLLRYFCQLDPKPVVAKAIRPELQHPLGNEEDR